MLSGGGFSPETVVKLNPVTGLQLPTGTLKSTFVSPLLIRVQIPGSVLQAAQFAAVSSLPIAAASPTFTVSADSMNPKTTGGGTASVGLVVSNPQPAIGHFLNVGIPNGANADIQIYGSNLLATPANHAPFTDVLVNGALVSRLLVQIDSSTPPQWIKFPVPAANMVAGATQIVLRNGTVESLPVQAPIAHLAPTLASVRVESAVTTSPNGQVKLALTGAHFYPDSVVTVDGNRSPLVVSAVNASGMTASFLYGLARRGQVVSVQVTNPYGGVSVTKSLVWP
jgi:hypothetical protein